MNDADSHVLVAAQFRWVLFVTCGMLALPAFLLEEKYRVIRVLEFL